MTSKALSANRKFYQKNILVKMYDRLNSLRFTSTIWLLFVCVCAEKSGSTALHRDKIVIFSSFSSFVILLIVLHCCLKHRKLRKEKRRRACLDCQEEMPGAKVDSSRLKRLPRMKVNLGDNVPDPTSSGSHRK